MKTEEVLSRFTLLKWDCVSARIWQYNIYLYAKGYIVS